MGLAKEFQIQSFVVGSTLSESTFGCSIAFTLSEPCVLGLIQTRENRSLRLVGMGSAFQKIGQDF